MAIKPTTVAFTPVHLRHDGLLFKYYVSRYLLLCTIPILASLISLIWTHESPRYLLEVGRDVDAMMVYQVIIFIIFILLFFRKRIFFFNLAISTCFFCLLSKLLFSPLSRTFSLSCDFVSCVAELNAMQRLVDYKMLCKHQLKIRLFHIFYVGKLYHWVAIT